MTKVIASAVILLAGIITGFLIAPRVQEALAVEIVSTSNPHGASTRVTKLEATNLEIPTFEKGVITQLFTAEKMTMKSEEIHFSSPCLLEFQPGTTKLKSRMTADNATMKRGEGGMSVDWNNMSWYGNFKYRNYGKEKMDASKVATEDGGPEEVGK